MGDTKSPIDFTEHERDTLKQEWDPLLAITSHGRHSAQ